MSATTAKDDLDDLILGRRVEQFLYLEARLADENRYTEWLDLWAQDAVYWVPANADDVDPEKHVSILYDQRQRLEDRVYRLTRPSAHAQDPASRMRRIISNVEHRAGDEPDEVLVSANFCIVEVRRGHRSVHAGRTDYVLRESGTNFSLVSKKVLLLDNDVPVGNITFLL